MKKFFFACAAFIFACAVFPAASAVEMSYPIAELGNCGSQDECRAYCDSPDNHLACIAWGQQQGVFSDMEAKRMEDMARSGIEDEPMAGPGGCQSPESCDVYCRVLENLEECLQYGEQHGYISTGEAQGAREKAQRGGPGGCNSRESCDAYCRNPDNMKVCMQFVVEEGKITQEEADLMVELAQNPDIGKPKGPEINEQKAMAVLEQVGAGPGGCKNPDECRAYCDGTEHMQECVSFATQNGLMSPEDAQRAQKLMSLGGGPGGCKNQQECDAFCRKEENRDTCMNFSKNSGLLSPEEIQLMDRQMTIIKKLEGGNQSGPGGCRSAQECSAYCSDPSRIKECMEFSAQTGMMDKNQAQTMMRQYEQAQQMQQFFMMGPPPGEGSGLPGQSGQYPQYPGMPLQSGMPLQPGMQLQPGMTPPPGYEGMGPEGQTQFQQYAPMMTPPEGAQQMQQFGPPQGMTPPPGMQYPNMAPGAEQYQQGPPPGYEGQQPPPGFEGPEGPPPPPAPTSFKDNPLVFLGNVLYSLFEFLR